ncbi:hypothetical protein [Paraburkholderia sp. J67]|uniref:hypothetical protein n=1 Tax=Paraburkholderia sp. J67 TaxID=2805435 RepID=UPI002ABD9AE9|nr:hypothetical protein [Paraburkholderia sp. J67]
MKRVYRASLTIAGDGHFNLSPHREAFPETLTFEQSAWRRGSRQILGCEGKRSILAIPKGVNPLPKNLTLKISWRKRNGEARN